MTLAYFCACCGHKADNNTTRGTTGDYNLTCPLCLAGIRFYIPLKPSRTDEEVEAVFQQTTLTDHQRTGRANTGKSAMKRKNTSYSNK